MEPSLWKSPSSSSGPHSTAPPEDVNSTGLLPDGQNQTLTHEQTRLKLVLLAQLEEAPGCVQALAVGTPRS